MLKKILLGSSLLLTTTTIALANPAPYIGAGLGVTTNTTSNNSLSSYRGMPFNVFAGYGGVINENLYLAGELQGTVGTANFSNSGVLKTSYAYGASVLPGIMLSDHTLAFARAGVVRTRFSGVGKSLTGGQLGLGMQTSLTQNIDIRGEYDYTAYQSFNRINFSNSPRTDAFNVGLVYKFD